MLRGIAMVLMTLDHASLFLDPDRWVGTELGQGAVSGSIPLGRFATRFLSHLCAPTFLFLVGVGVASSIDQRRARGASERDIDQHLIGRGLWIAALDPLLISFGTERVWLQVLFVIGLGIALLAPLRRLPTWVFAAIALAWWAGGEALVGGSTGNELGGPLWVPSKSERVIVFYPVLPWLAVIAGGFAIGQSWVRRRERGQPALVPRELATVGLALLGLHAVLRGLGAYGNLDFPSVEPALLSWLHVAKQPPSAAFLAFVFGWMALVLAGLQWCVERRPIARTHPLAVFGETALFFYLVHWCALRAFASLTGWKGHISLCGIWAVTFATLILMFAMCVGFRAARRKVPFLRLL